jgi:hypothetical protein
VRSTQETRRWAFYNIGAMMTTQDRCILHGPYPPCNVPGCPEPAYHLHGKRCAPHAFSPQMSGEPLPLREPIHGDDLARPSDEPDLPMPGDRW